MGVLYYAHKLTDPPEMFAGNKAYHWGDVDALMEAFPEDGRRLAEVAPTPEQFIARFIDPETPRDWAERIAARFFAWAGDAPVWWTSEYWCDGDGRHPLEAVYAAHYMPSGGDEWDWQERAITGSAYDSDYEADGMTYKPGSAW